MDLQACTFVCWVGVCVSLSCAVLRAVQHIDGLLSAWLCFAVRRSTGAGHRLSCYGSIWLYDVSPHIGLNGIAAWVGHQSREEAGHDVVCVL